MLVIEFWTLASGCRCFGLGTYVWNGNWKVYKYVFIEYRVAVDVSVVDTLLCTSTCSLDSITGIWFHTGAYLNEVQL